MKRQVAIIILLILNALIVFMPVDNVRGDPSGGNIDGDSVWWENEYAHLEVYPHTSNEFIRQKQFANLTWKESDNTIDVAFRFNDSLSYGKIWKWDGADWNEVTMQHTTYNGKHYYYYTGFNVVQDTVYRFKWQYDVLANTTGKWDLFAKLNEHTIQQALDNNWYVALDPWWDSSWFYFKTIDIASSFISGSLRNFPVNVNSTDTVMISKCQANGEDIRFVGTNNLTEFHYEIEKWTPDGFSIWVNISEVIDDNNDYTFLMYYGNAVASDNQTAELVWDGDYLGVYHLNQSSGVIAHDSTANNNNGTYVGNLPSRVTSKAGWGQDLDGASYISFPDGCWLTGTNFGMHEIFLSQSSESGLYMTQWDNSATDRIYFSVVGGNYFSHGEAGGVTQWSMTDDAIITFQWTHIISVLEENNARLVVNGFIVADDTLCTMPSVAVSNKLAINFGTSYSADSNFLTATADEIRISDVVRNVSWINASFHSINQTPGFMTLGIEFVQEGVNSDPINSNPDPQNNNRTNSITPALRIQVNDTNMADQSVNITWLSNSSGSWIQFGLNYSAVNDTFYQTFDNATTPGETYWWSVNTNDGNSTGWDNDTYSFTINIAPAFSDEVPTNESIADVGTDLNITILDGDGDTFNYTIEVDPQTTTSGRNVGSRSENGESNGTKTLTVNLSHNVNYTWYVNCTDGYIWTNASYNFIAQILNVEPPTNVTTNILSNNTFDIVWDNGTNAITTVVRRKLDSYPTSVTDGTQIYNDTGEWVNVQDLGVSYFYSLWSYNETYSSSVNITVGGIVLYCFDEDTNGTLEFDIFISNEDGSQTHEQRNITNGYILNVSDLPLGDAVKFVVSASQNYSDQSEDFSFGADENQTITYITLSFPPEDKFSTNVTCVNETAGTNSYPPFTLVDDLVTILADDADSFTIVFVNYTYGEYERRTYYRSISTSSFYLLNAYLPPNHLANLYLLTVSDESDQPLEDAYIEVKNKVNNTYVTVSSLYTDASGNADLFLIENDNYIFVISKDGYITENASWTPGDLIFTQPFTLKLESEDIEPDTIGSVINLQGQLYDDNTLKVTFYDKNNEMINSHFYIHEYYNDILTYMGEYNGTTEYDFVFWVDVVNTSRMHAVVLFMNHTSLGVVADYTIYVNPLPDERDEATWLESLIRSIFGDWDYGYVVTVIWFIPCIILLAGFGSMHQPGIGILGVGMWSGWFTFYLNMPNEGDIIVLAGFALLVAFIVIALKQGKKVISE